MGESVELAQGAPVVARLSWRDRGFVLGVAALIAAGHSIAAPFVANQNSYLLHAVGDTDPRLAEDWLTHTTDPYPFFTTVMRLSYGLGGELSLRVLAYLATIAGLLAVFMLARQVSPVRSLGVPVVAMILMGLTLSVGRLGSFLPLDWSVSAFQGFAGQYVLMKPGYVQPSTAGVLLLLSIPLWLAYFREGSPRRPHQPFAAIGLTALACMLGPTYLVVAGMAMAAAVVADLLTGARVTRLPWYAGTLVLSAVVTIVANPAMLGLGSSGLSDAAALRRFAFDLFPIHTLVTNWPADDSTLLVVIALAVILGSGLVMYRWLARWILVATAAALGVAVVVYVTRVPALAILFPWRVSVLVVPVAATLLAVQAALLTRRIPHDAWRWKLLLLAAVVAVPGVASTMSKHSPAVEEAPVAAVVAAQPRGVGVIPLATGTLRLNARLPVYVDSMSPPYASGDLVEWWTRVDQVQRFWNEPETFCTADWATGIDWLLLPTGSAVPSCVSGWTSLESGNDWRVLQRP
jgi:hypothetical protein